MGRIHILDPTTANQIAAGEVVERPASVLKELVENSIDAGATRIAVALSHGGKTRLAVADDGHGILREDVERAFERHATSKIEAARDLERLRTLGFRGEALPATASVARVSLTTLAAGELEGTRIEIHGGERISLAPAAAAPGTAIEVRDLFFNVPARLKFLKSTGAETAAASQAFLRQALAHPGIHFSFASAGREDWVLARCASRRERAAQVLGSERVRDWLEAAWGEAGGRGLRIEALLEAPRRHHPTRGEQYLFVNQRAVSDSRLQHAVLRAYEGLLPPARFPAVLLFLELDPALVDVNVHPAKTEVRFADPAAIHSRVQQALREALVKGGFVPQARAAPVRGPGFDAPAPATDRMRPPAGAEPGRAAAAPEAPSGRAYRIHSRDAWTPAAAEARAPLWREGQERTPPDVDVSARIRVLGQFRDTFVVAEDAQGLVLLDQHTAHERVLFEQLERGEHGPVRAQRLLLPQMVEMGPADGLRLAAFLEDLAFAGIEVDAMGGHTFAVRSLPAGIEPGAAARLLSACAGDGGEGLGAAAPRRKVLATIACHAAVKRRMPLERSAMERLVSDVLRCQDPYLCPHGRAVILRFGNEEIQKSFGRYW